MERAMRKDALTWIASPARRMLFAFAGVIGAFFPWANFDSEAPMSAAPATWMIAMIVISICREFGKWLALTRDTIDRDKDYTQNQRDPCSR